jgi:2-polyprenyl-3-methyl-5-hydroxy-6-metoxy-1,4-benzoquinol methylase
METRSSPERVTQASDVSSQHVERFDPSELGGRNIETEHRARYEFAARFVEDKNVLDAGCGVGYGALLLREAGASSVLGVDLAEDAVEKAQRTCTERTGIEFKRGDVCALSLDDHSIDVVVCFEVIEHLADADAAIGEFARVLTDGGILLVSSPNPARSVEGNPFHVREYLPDELAALVRNRFDCVALARQDPVLASFISSTDENRHQRRIRGLGMTSMALPAEPGCTIALASNMSVPEVRDLVLLGPSWETKYWIDAVADLTALAEDRRRSLHELEVTKDALEFELAHRDSRERELGERLADLGHALVHAEGIAAKVSRAEAEQEEATARAARAERAAAERADALTNLESETGQLRTQLHATLSSKSWRLTAPLRAARRVLRGNAPGG